MAQSLSLSEIFLSSCQSGVWQRDSKFRGYFGQYETGQCGAGNPETGYTCSCPTGTISQQIWVYRYFDTPYTGYSLSIGRSHVCTPFTNAHLVCLLLL